MPFTASDICKIIFAVILPPLGVFLERGCGADVLINICLTILGYIPGIIHALLSRIAIYPLICIRSCRSMLLACGGWRSSVLLVASVFVGLAQIAVADCKSSGNDQWLARDIPSCALSCVKHFIQSEFNTGSCCDGTSRSCLCRTNSTSGLTLGEVALACTYGSCSDDTIDNVTSKVYTICNDVNGALPETHATITATRVPEIASISSPLVTSSPLTATRPSITSSPPTTKPLTWTSQTTLATSTWVSNTQIIPPVTTFSTPAIPSPTTSLANNTSTAASSASATAPPSSSGLGSSAVIGISVASGVSAIFLVSVAVFLCGKELRRRKLHAQANEGFEIGGDMSEPPDFYSRMSPNPPHPFPTLGGGAVSVNSGPNFHQFPTQPVARNGPLQIITPTQGIGIGGAGFTPKMDYEDSPQSQTSQHTLSQLLPSNPTTQGLFPEPLTIIRYGPQLQPRLRPSSEATMIDEEGARQKSVFGPPLDQPQSHARQVSDGAPNGRRPVGLPANPRPTIRPVGGRGKEHTLRMGGKLYRWETPDDVGLPPTPPPKSDGSIQVGRAVTRYSTSLQGPRSSPVKPGTGNMQLQRNFSRLGSGLRSMSRISRTLEEPNAASHSRERDPPVENNEIVGYNDDDEYHRLGRSPVKYPTMPRSAAVAPVAEALPAPRAALLYERSQPDGSSGSPVKGLFNIPLIIDSPSRSRSSSPSGLLAKRRGERMAERMESQFRIGVQNTQGLPTQQTRGRPRWNVRKVGPDPVSVAGSITPGTPQDGTKPPQKHNITPTRRGEDLYLSVD
ncbi:uncharacterized protein TRUGW13939_10228 [Talaromyces rugulosus]|uniref:CFEM domain-containing protein n=1 Tax=Talaromyces rugulosus TaxID=121627 RepID=A0A7H8R9G6_TALRU|nr:uncharacterized protein TRUGW13939_10228 [Talaromyces rugulosus]QKX63060.1 hypothetical protein TRUGW13939_10228 [Talaromyces rugulosus]